VQFILFSTVSSYSLKIPSDSIEFSAERTMEGDVEIYQSFSASLTHQSAVENVPEPENTYTPKSYTSDQRRMDDKPTDLNINKAPPRGRVPPLPRPFPNPDAYNDRRIPTKKSTSVDTLSENRLDFTASLHAGGPTATSEFKKHESKSGAEQTQTDNFQKPEPLTPNQKFYGGLVISLIVAWVIAKTVMFIQTRPQNNSRYTWFIYDHWSASEMKEMNAMRERVLARQDKAAKRGNLDKDAVQKDGPILIISFDGGGVKGTLGAQIIKRLATDFPDLISRTSVFAGV
jgi:hypothetical protein